ncbi:MAG: NADH-quinone oxidoreductase subunit N [Candidatus Manganitrophus sp.]|nr:NADH-quinone oxidoreductase subunit N [Candidatus Manganitrophus sp.]
MTTPMPDLGMIAILPELVLALLACLLFVLVPFVPKEKRDLLGYFSIGALIVSGLLIIPLWGKNVSAFSGMIALDPYAVFFKVLFLIIALLVILISFLYLKIERVHLAEYYGLILFATVGMMLMPASSDLLSFYLSLELMSMSFYILAAFMRKDAKSVESGMKYFLTGVFTSGLILYGIAFLYGAAGTTNLKAIQAFLSQANIGGSPTLILGLILLTAGFAFKIAAVPFHMWAPDVYEGAPTPITAFLSAGSKAATLAVMLRVFISGLSFSYGTWWQFLWIIAVLTMTVGNVAALVQTNVKRLLAYSSIAHAGYILIGLIAASQVGLASVLIYLVSYIFMTIGAFTMIILLCRFNSRGDQISDFKGLARTHPAVAAAFVLFALSLIGIPPTAGFVGKLFLFNAAIQGGFYWLAIIGILNSTISLYYYFKIVMVMYMEEPQGSTPSLSRRRLPWRSG